MRMLLDMFVTYHSNAFSICKMTDEVEKEADQGVEVQCIMLAVRTTRDSVRSQSCFPEL
jgi:hypothetical protein